MGNSYTNILLRSVNQKNVAQYLDKLKRKSFVLPVINDLVVICDEECDTYDTRIIADLTNMLSKEFMCVAFSVVNFDDDILWYQLYENGALLDEYNSNPTDFETGDYRDPLGGDANILCEIFDQSNSIKKVENVLHNGHSDGYLFEIDRHSDLVKLLGWNNPYIYLSYRDIFEAIPDIGDIYAKTLLRQDVEHLCFDSQSIQAPAPFDLDKEIATLLKKNKKISAIILYQQHKMCSLVEARSYIDELEKKM